MKIRTYQEAIEFLYNQTPQFQQIGAAAYKPGLDTTRRLDDLFGNAHRNYKTIHVGGTNGKGSTAHTLAAVLQSAGLKVGLYTSPHLVDFRERIRVNGRKIPERDVIGFLNRFLESGFDGQPSFFELTTIMAFDCFSREKTDVAVIEVGLGGRLDSTNIITPDLSIITNISRDHVAQLGYELTSIATEKAGIIKPGVPALVGEAEGEVRQVFADRANEVGTTLEFAVPLENSGLDQEHRIVYPSTPFGELRGELTGDCQPKNAATIVTALRILRDNGWNIPDAAVRKGFASVVELTSLYGRWMKVCDSPLTITDTGHNEGGWRYLSRRLSACGDKLHVVIGFVNDKDVAAIMGMLPTSAHYYFTRASVPRALDEQTLRRKGLMFGLEGESYPSVETALEAARANASDGDTIFVGGSTFIVADLMRSLEKFRSKEE